MRSENFNAILLAFLGCLFAVAYLWTSSSTRSAKLLRQYVPRSEILGLAQEAFDSSELYDYDMERQIRVGLDETLHRYAQRNVTSDGSTPFLPIGYWDVSWRGQVTSKKEGTQEVSFRVRFDFKGNLIGLEQTAPPFNEPPNFKESEALAEAMNSLHSLNIDTTTIELKSNITNRRNRVLSHDFVFSTPSTVSLDLRDRYAITISGRFITNFSANTILDLDRFNFPALNRTSRIVGAIVMLAIWLLIALFLLVQFFKRLKHDELEFRRALWLGVVASIATWAFIVITSWPHWRDILVSGGLAGPIVGFAAVLTYSVADSISRGVWPQRIALTDVLFRGFFRVREMGIAILNSLFMTGVTLAFIAGLLWLSDTVDLGYVALWGDLLRIFESNAAMISIILKNVIFSLFIGLALFVFWLTYLKAKIRSETVLLILLALFVNMAGLHFYFLRPVHLSFGLFLPLAFFWAFCARRYDPLAILVSLITVNLFLDLFLVGLLPNGMFSVPGLISSLAIAIMLTVGTYLVLSPRELKDFRHYIPEYVSRIAEREKFLKELEIAHSVQMRFLPQTVPSFPNLDIASICRPAREVGGDYYDFIVNGDHSVGVIIGDVSGKGVSAAFYMTMVKGIIKTLTKTAVTPKIILTQMNSIFYENAPNDIFISVIYALFDLEKNTLTFARAGHNPVIFHTLNGKGSEVLHPRGLAIGLDKGQLFSDTIEEISVAFNEGDTFLFFTDGISESMNKQGDEFGEERLRDIVNRSAHSSAKELADRITREVNLFAGEANQHDDLTMVVVKACGGMGK